MGLSFDTEKAEGHFHCPFENKLCRYITYAERNVIIVDKETGELQCKALVRHAPPGTRCSYLQALNDLRKAGKQ